MRYRPFAQYGFYTKRKELRRECRIDFQISNVAQFQRFLRDLREYFAKCLTSRCRANWTTQGIARVQYWWSQVLKTLDEKDAAERESKAARAIKDQFLENYREVLEEYPENEVAVLGQMLPIWIMQSTGRL